jgi:hypothetical protein
MVFYTNSLSDIVLLHPTRSLLLQLHEWQKSRGGFALRLVSSGSLHVIREAVDHAVAAVIDATDHPDEAMEILQDSLEQAEPGKLVVYTEVLHDGLEMFVRTRGAPFWLGPMRQAEWAQALRATWPAEVAPGR